MRIRKLPTAKDLHPSVSSRFQSAIEMMGPSESQTRKRKTTNAPRYSVLEPKHLLASVTLNGGEITIGGTTGADSATVSISDGAVSVVQPGFDTETFTASSVSSIRFIGLAGDDFFENTTAIPSFAFGQAGNDILIGGPGVDELAGNIGNDFIDGGGGNDRLIAGNGNDEVNGGTGDDTILGTAGLNTLQGDAGDDDIFGGNDVDMIFGGDGSDELSGNGADDTISGGAGVDFVNAGPGNDTINGDDGNDFLYGQAGDDIIEGDAGNDAVGGNGGNDTLRGGTGNDFLSAGTGDDELFGEAGNDRLFVIAGNNTLSGGASSATNDLQAMPPLFQDLAIFTGFKPSFQVKSGQDGGIETVDFRDTELADGAQVETLGDQNIISSDVENFFFFDPEVEDMPGVVETAARAINVVEQVIVRPIIVSNDNGSNTAEFIGDAEQAADIQVRIDRIFAQAGIDVVWQATRETNNTFINLGTGGGTRTSADLNTIISQGDSSGLGSTNATVVDAYFVERVPGFARLSDDQANGLAFQDQSGLAVHIGDNLVGFEAGRVAVARVIAHEIGHNLGLGHVGGTNNLLTVPSSTDLLTEAQQRTILASNISRPVAASVSGILAGSATSVEADVQGEALVQGTVSSSDEAQVDSSTSLIGGCGGCGVCAACAGGIV